MAARKAASQPSRAKPSRPAKPMGGLHKALVFMVVASIIADAALIAHSAAEIWFFGAARDGVFQTEADLMAVAAWIDTPAQWVGIASIITVVVTAIVYIWFVFRMTTNLEKFGAKGLRTGSGWVIAYHFIPIISLFKPYQILADGWIASHDVNGRLSEPALMRIWWGAWLIGNFAGTIAFRMSMSSGAMGAEITDLDLYVMSSWIGIVGSALGIASCVALLPIIKQITQAMSADRFAEIFD